LSLGIWTLLGLVLFLEMDPPAALLYKVFGSLSLSAIKDEFSTGMTSEYIQLTGII